MIKLIVLSLCFIITLNNFAVADVPSFVPICGRKNPKFDDCVVNSVNTLKPRLAKGIPELDAPPLEPLLLPEGLPIADSKDLKAQTTNLKLWNISNFTITEFRGDLNTKTIALKLHYDSIKANGDVSVNAKILVPINAAGKTDIVTDGVDADVVLKFKLITTKKGVQPFFTSMTCKLKIADYKAKFTGSGELSATLAQAIDSVLNSNRQELLESLGPSLEKAVSATVLKIANQIVKNFTYDELFPDSE